MNGWSDAEEIELLYATEKYGLGNWYVLVKYFFYFLREDIAEKCHRGSQECYEHYSSFYLHGPCSNILCGFTPELNTVNDHTSISSTAGQEKPVALEPIEQQLLGYTVMRDDFERDYDNDAESLLTRLNVRSDCDDLENGGLVYSFLPGYFPFITSSRHFFSFARGSCKYLHPTSSGEAKTQRNRPIAWAHLSALCVFNL